MEGSRGTGPGQADAKADKERGEVATPTHRFVESKPKGKAPRGMLQVLYQIRLFMIFQSLIDLAENPLDRRALVSLKKHLEIDQPNNKLLSVSLVILKKILSLDSFYQL